MVNILRSSNQQKHDKKANAASPLANKDETKSTSKNFTSMEKLVLTYITMLTFAKN